MNAKLMIMALLAGLDPTERTDLVKSIKDGSPDGGGGTEPDPNDDPPPTAEQLEKSLDELAEQIARGEQDELFAGDDLRKSLDDALPGVSGALEAVAGRLADQNADLNSMARTALGIGRYSQQTDSKVTGLQKSLDAVNGNLEQLLKALKLPVGRRGATTEAEARLRAQERQFGAGGNGGRGEPLSKALVVRKLSTLFDQTTDPQQKLAVGEALQKAELNNFGPAKAFIPELQG